MKLQFGKLLPVICLFACGTTPVKAANFTREYLEGRIDEYLNALVAHNHSGLLTTPCVTYVENSQFIPIGTGEWKLASSLGAYRHTWSDPVSQQVATITTLKENGVSLIYIVRLKIENDGKISEIETQITRDSVGAGRYENMTTPEAVWLQPVPVEERISRAKLIEQTNKYYTGMERNDPKGDYSFFHKDCDRLEDGLKTTNQKNGDPYGHSNDTGFASLGCEAQFQTGFLGFVTKIRDRRYPVVDEERQAVFAITLFDHNGTVRKLPSVNGTSSPIPPYFDVPRTLAASEGFRLRGEKLYRIEMTLTEVPYGQSTAFVADPERNTTGPGTNLTIAEPCDYSCLQNAALLVLQGMLNNDTASLPLHKGVIYRENSALLDIGDGLWQTLNHFSIPGVDDYAGIFAEPTGSVGRDVAYWGQIQEHSTPGVLLLTVKVIDGKITEILAFVVRAESRGERGGTVTLMRPPLPVEWDGSSLGKLTASIPHNNTRRSEALSIGFQESYYNALRDHTSKGAKVHSSCTRRDNGFQAKESCLEQLDGKGAAPNGLFNWTTAIRETTFHVQDNKKGVAVFSGLLDYPGTAPLPQRANEKVPGTYLVIQLLKFREEYIEKIEGFVKWVPYGYSGYLRGFC
ncbi:hypothetical protein B0J11DRAFT_580147 [Dendryphion nanum]|uniref:DUF8021 domain-containing protein n=1 Tax=Dendryphion nanum TaxID=256645 RepID=A0A9P9DUG0_9PLEO|nr:hypothetical protein B0J11DRAFT_580147 [Dendryphion nanum]